MDQIYSWVKTELKLTAFKELITLSLCKERSIRKVFDLKYLYCLQSMSKCLCSYYEVWGVPRELAAMFIWIKLEDAGSPISPLEKGCLFKCVNNGQCSKFNSLTSIPGLTIIQIINEICLCFYICSPLKSNKYKKYPFSCFGFEGWVCFFFFLAIVMKKMFAKLVF